MTAAPADSARAMVYVAVAPADAFRIFTEDIDAWWRRGPKYRVLGGARAVLHLEPRVGGRIFEAVTADAGAPVTVTGTVRVWEPPSRLVFEWRARNFAPDELTTVEVLFEAQGPGTRVTVTHRGFAALRPDHPVRHGQSPAAFLRTMGLFWGDLLTALRLHAGA